MKNRKLYKAIFNSDIEEIKTQLKNNNQEVFLDKNGITDVFYQYLDLAIGCDNPEAVRVLLSHINPKVAVVDMARFPKKEGKRATMNFFQSVCILSTFVTFEAVVNYLKLTKQNMREMINSDINFKDQESSLSLGDCMVNFFSCNTIQGRARPYNKSDVPELLKWLRDTNAETRYDSKPVDLVWEGGDIKVYEKLISLGFDINTPHGIDSTFCEWLDSLSVLYRENNVDLWKQYFEKSSMFHGLKYSSYTVHIDEKLKVPCFEIEMTNQIDLHPKKFRIIYDVRKLIAFVHRKKLEQEEQKKDSVLIRRNSFEKVKKTIDHHESKLEEHTTDIAHQKKVYADTAEGMYSLVIDSYRGNQEASAIFDTIKAIVADELNQAHLLKKKYFKDLNLEYKIATNLIDVGAAAASFACPFIPTVAAIAVKAPLLLSQARKTNHQDSAVFKITTKGVLPIEKLSIVIASRLVAAAASNASFDESALTDAVKSAIKKLPSKPATESADDYFVNSILTNLKKPRSKNACIIS